MLLINIVIYVQDWLGKILFINIIYSLLHSILHKSHHYFNLLSCCPDQTILATVNSIATFCLEFFILATSPRKTNGTYSLSSFWNLRSSDRKAWSLASLRWIERRRRENLSQTIYWKYFHDSIKIPRRITQTS